MALGPVQLAVEGRRDYLLEVNPLFNCSRFGGPLVPPRSDDTIHRPTRRLYRGEFRIHLTDLFAEVLIETFRTHPSSEERLFTSRRALMNTTGSKVSYGSEVCELPAI